MDAARAMLLALVSAAALACGADGAWMAQGTGGAGGTEKAKGAATGPPTAKPAKPADDADDDSGGDPDAEAGPDAKSGPRANDAPAKPARASLPVPASPTPRPRAFEVNPEANEEERRDALEALRDAALRYAEELDTVLLEAEDVVSTCERSPADGAAIGGPPRHLEAKRARAKFAKDVSAFERAAAALGRKAKAPVPEADEPAARALARSSEADVRALKAINEYVTSRGDDKHEEFAKARAKLKLVREGLLASQRMKALKALGLVGEGK